MTDKATTKQTGKTLECGTNVLEQKRQFPFFSFLIATLLKTKKNSKQLPGYSWQNTSEKSQYDYYYSVL